jgi:hypothetical protein
MAGAKLIRFFGRVQRIREKQQAVDELNIFRDKNCRLPATVRMSAKEYWSCVSLFHDGNRSPQTVAVSCGAAGRRRAVRALGAEWQIESQYGEAGRSKGVGNFDEQFRLAIRAGAMREDDGAAVRLGRRVHEAAKRKFGSEINEGGKHKRPRETVDSRQFKVERRKNKEARLGEGYPPPPCFCKNVIRWELGGGGVRKM